MATIYIVRHGKAAAGFDGHPDPSLDDLGRQQADATARELAPLGPLPILSSPLARARETAAPLCELWGQTATIESRVAEIPSPMADLKERSAWLGRAMQGNWTDLGPELQTWRNDLAACLIEQTTDVAIFCHFVAINLAVGAAMNDDRMVIFRPDNGAVTKLVTDGQTLSLIDLGRSADTFVN